MGVGGDGAGGSWGWGVREKLAGGAGCGLWFEVRGEAAGSCWCLCGREAHVV